VYEALGADFTLIDLGAPDGALAFERAAAKLRIPLKVISDRAADGRERYQSRLILVRPDQYVAWTGDKADDAVSVLRRATGSCD
jgi:hypothetical protein